MSAAVAARSVHRGDGGLQLVLPHRPERRGPRSSSVDAPRRRAARSHRERSCSASGHERARRRRCAPGARASSEQHQGEQPGEPPACVGHAGARAAGSGGSPRGTARSAAPSRRAVLGVALVEERGRARAARERSALGTVVARTAYEQPAPERADPGPSRARCAAPSSPPARGTHYAISAVVRPPTARRVRASCDGADSDGWQHQEQQRQRVVVDRPASCAGTSHAMTRSSRSRRARVAAPQRRRAAGRRSVTSQARGSSGTPVDGPVRVAAASSASWTASSARVEVAEPAAERCRGPAARASRSRSSTPVGRAQCGSSPGPRKDSISAPSAGASSITRRTEIGCCVGTPLRPGHS